MDLDSQSEVLLYIITKKYLHVYIVAVKHIGLTIEAYLIPIVVCNNLKNCKMRLGKYNYSLRDPVLPYLYQ